jgi:hypothetical protein
MERMKNWRERGEEEQDEITFAEYMGASGLLRGECSGLGERARGSYGKSLGRWISSSAVSEVPFLVCGVSIRFCEGFVAPLNLRPPRIGLQPVLACALNRTWPVLLTCFSRAPASRVS